MAVETLSEIAKIMGSKTTAALDESSRTMQKRLDPFGVASTPETNARYREMLLTTEGVEDFASAVILFKETFEQSIGSGLTFPKLLISKGMVPVIKMDEGLGPLSGHDPDQSTKGLATLKERLPEFISLGAQAAKWRCVYKIEDGHPSNEIIKLNAETLAEYALICQESGIVPMVEPEVLIDGTHSIYMCAEVTGIVLESVFEELARRGVSYEEMVLKPNMVIPGKDSGQKVDSSEIAMKTLAVMRAQVDPRVPSLAFLSGGQPPGEATKNLNAMNVIKNREPKLYEWVITASFGREYQGPALLAWSGKEENVKVAQLAFRNSGMEILSASRGQLEIAARKSI